MLLPCAYNEEIPFGFIRPSRVEESVHFVWPVTVEAKPWSG